MPLQTEYVSHINNKTDKFMFQFDLTFTAIMQI